MLKYRTFIASTFLVAFAVTATAQQTAPAAQPHMPTPEERAAIAAASAAERNRELKLLGITAMQPPATAYDIGKPGNANYDESRANPYPNLPALLVMQNGAKVTKATQWPARRKELLSLFAENVYGKYPAHIPGVSWKVESTQEMNVAGVPAVGDSLRDLQAGAAAGCEPHLVLTGKGEAFRGVAELPPEFPPGSRVHADLPAFADWLIAREAVAREAAARLAPSA